MAYAESTDVSAEKSRDEIERTLQRYGATGFMYGWEDANAMVIFKMKDRQIKFLLQMPTRDERRFWFTEAKHIKRTEQQAYAAWEQATRQKWRALALAVKAKLEVVDAGISTFEHEFMAHIVLPGGKTVGDWMSPQIESAYNSGIMPRLLPAMGETGESGNRQD